MTLAFVHIPRTGGLALTEALRGTECPHAGPRAAPVGRGRGHNASTRRSTLSPEGEAAVRAWYADDYALLERLT